MSGTLPPPIWQMLAQAARARAARRELYGAPCSLPAVARWWIHDRVRWGPLGNYLTLSRRIPGWTRGPEAIALAQMSRNLPDGAVILENGCFLGCSTVLLAGARKLRGSGIVHVVDPFDASGEAFSAPVYRGIRDSRRASLRARFEANLRRADLTSWVMIHQGHGESIATTWQTPIDLLFLDGDQSREGVRATFEAWAPFLKVGSVIAVHNSAPGEYHDGHDGSLRLVEEVIRPPRFEDAHRVGMTTFARRAK